MLLTKSELSFSLEVVSAVSGSVVMVLQITSLTFSWTSAPSTSLSWDTNHTQQYSELTTWKIEVHVCVQFCLVMWWIYHYPHIFLHSLKFKEWSSDFVTSACCVLDKQKSPKTQNNSWHASCRTQRSINWSEHACVFVEIYHSCNFCGSYFCLSISRALK